ncbi:MAG: hypothetical protein O7B29_14350 [Deltaproteobacteria bacterium]|nr:hypothetical protein [Deltaproteobacteria bacterium]
MPRRVIVALILFLSATLAGPIAAEDSTPRLSVLLERLSRAATLFHDNALEFACDERIVWKGRGRGSGSANFEYIFAYDDRGELEDYRTNVSARKRKKAPREVRPEDSGVPTYVRSAYLWVLTFHESRQPSHTYRIEGEEVIRGVSTVKIAFDPIPPYRDRFNDWFGIAWIDPEMAQIVRLVAYRLEDEEVRRLLDEFRRGGELEKDRYELRTITTDFTETKNGLRLPGSIRIEKATFWAKNRKRLEEHKKVLLEVEQTFTGYRFFSVRSEVEMRDFIRDGTQLE